MRKFIPLAVALALAGCSFTPEYQRPAAPVPSAWPGSATAGGAITAADWRSIFTDPQLQELITAALEHNRDLRIAVARVVSSAS